MAAAARPDGTIRWREARDLYLQRSECARSDESVGATHFHLNLQQIFRRYFVRLEKGKYRLRDWQERMESL